LPPRRSSDLGGGTLACVVWLRLAAAAASFRGHAPSVRGPRGEGGKRRALRVASRGVYRHICKATERPGRRERAAAGPRSCRTQRVSTGEPVGADRKSTR